MDMKELEKFIYGTPNKKMNIDEYIEQHSHICYCESIIYPDGMIEDVKPSHQETLIRVTGKSRDEIWNEMPSTESAIDWLVDKTSCICVWYNYILAPKNITREQSASLIKLYKNDIIVDNSQPYY